jgi:transcriptional regulator of nitric oxide reductase
MTFSIHRTLIAIVLQLCCLISQANAGNLVKSDIERMVDYFYMVGEILPDIPVYPLFVRDAANPDAKPELKAYVFESIDFAPVRGYSAKPINLLILIDMSGNFIRVRLLDHKEPLFLDSSGTQKLERFASQYKGLTHRHTIEIGPFNDPGLRDENVAHVKGVQQGTISVKAINRAILTAAAAVATAKLKIGADDNVSAPVSPAIPKESKEAKDQKLTTASEENKTLNTPSKPIAEIRLMLRIQWLWLNQLRASTMAALPHKRVLSIHRPRNQPL